MTILPLPLEPHILHLLWIFFHLIFSLETEDSKKLHCKINDWAGWKPCSSGLSLRSRAVLWTEPCRRTQDRSSPSQLAPPALLDTDSIQSTLQLHWALGWHCPEEPCQLDLSSFNKSMALQVSGSSRMLKKHVLIDDISTVLAGFVLHSIMPMMWWHFVLLLHSPPNHVTYKYCTAVNTHRGTFLCFNWTSGTILALFALNRFPACWE